jgi:NAD(P)-dependent dehydrogenase (short-subunit alcohol dehydrogenase family)
MNQRQTHDPRADAPAPPFPRQQQATPGEEASMRPRPDYGEASYVGLGRMAGKIALVTGGDSGIGRAVALAFAREGADVTVAYLNEERDAQESKRVIEASGRRALLRPGDIAEDAHCARLVADTVAAFGRIDVLVNNAAFQGPAVERFEQLDAQRIARTLSVNLAGLFHLTRHALPHMKPGSSIINVASIQAYKPKASILDYATTKGGIVTFTKGLAQELIERGIRVNCVAPGPVWTPLVVQSFDEKKVSEFGKDSPMQRPAQPVELAPAFVFLACDESRYVNGEVLGVTGGKPLA